MIAFRYLSMMGLIALCLTSSTNSASLVQRDGFDFQAAGQITVSIKVFVEEFIKLDVEAQVSVLAYFSNNQKPYGFTWHQCVHHLPPDYRLPGCPPPPLKGCPVPPHGCRPPPPQWYCPKPPKKSKHPHQKVCPKPPPKPPICKPWQKGFYHLKPEDEHI